MTRILRVALLTVGDPHRLTGGYLYHRRMAELAPQHDARITFVSIPDRRFPLGVLGGPTALKRVEEVDTDVLLLDSVAAAFVGPWRALGRGGLPMAAILHQPPGGIDHGPARARIQASLDRMAYRHKSRLLVASESLADALAAQGFGRERMVVVPPGRDVAAEKRRDVRDLRGGRRVAVLCVGNWVERKGIHHLLEALTFVPHGVATLHLVGDVEADRRYAKRIYRLLCRPNLADRVVVHGPVSREEVAALYAAADIFALPSTKEPYGTVLGEAMATGLPVIGWRAGNLPYLADDGVEGVVLEPGDIVGLAAAIQQLAADAHVRRRMGDAAKRRSIGRPTWDESAALFFRELSKVAGPARAARPATSPT